jgi:hypothetical protein
MIETNDIDLLNADLHAQTGPSWGDIYLEDDTTEVSYLASVAINDGHLRISVYHPEHGDSDDIATYQFDITDRDQ